MRRKVVGLGELLWDVLPGGRQLGGAPANFDYHAGALGAEAHVISRVGRDADGRELVARLEQLGIGTACIEEDSAAPTSTVTVSLGGDGQPCYTIHENVAWDALAGEAAARRAVATADAIYFGTLAQRSETSRRTIRTLLGFVPPTALRISWQSAPRGGRLVRARRAGDWSEHAGLPTIVADTVGAGDAFTAALALGLLAGWPLDTVSARATALAAYVCSQPGATPPLPEPLCAPFLQA